MRIYFIRHGDPNYKDNCLTPLGHQQAEALAERWAVSAEKVDRIYSSKFGRAVETAEPTAAKLGLPVEILDFMHEICPSCLLFRGGYRPRGRNQIRGAGELKRGSLHIGRRLKRRNPGDRLRKH